VGGGPRRRPRPTPLSRQARPARSRKGQRRPGNPARGKPRAGSTGFSTIPGRAREPISIAETGRRASARRRKALRPNGPCSLTGGRGRRSWCSPSGGSSLGWQVRHGASEAPSPTLEAAENAALEERGSRLREEAGGTSSAGPDPRGEANRPAQAERFTESRDLGCEGGKPKRKERRQTRLPRPAHAGRIRTVRIGCSWGRSIVAHVGETHLVRSAWRAPQGVRRAGGVAERKARAGRRRRGTTVRDKGAGEARGN